MATGACGINCDVCQLNLMGQCTSCGPGRSDLATRKSSAQQRLLGHPCAILECARLNHIDYCSRDCAAFPCANFTDSAYPYGRAFLDMQHRRRKQGPPAVDPAGRPIVVDPAWWETLDGRNKAQVTNFTLTELDNETGHLTFRFLNRKLLVDTAECCVFEDRDRQWIPLAWPMLELTVLDYFSHIGCLHPMGREMVGPQDLSEALYFSGQGRLPTESLLRRYGNDPRGFAAAGTRLGGHLQPMADAAVRLMPFPRIPVYYLLWLASDEFAPRITILFDRSIEKVLSPPAIWCLVNLCTYCMLLPG